MAHLKTLNLLAALLSVFILYSPTAQADKLYVAGGCFWCVEADFERVKGVREVSSGFSGGDVAKPSYKQVTNGGTGHREAVEIDFDPSVISRATLINMFLRSIDPTDEGGQFCDRGFGYSSAIYFANNQEKAIAQREVKNASIALGQKIVTPVVAFKNFYKAEDYHQDYYKGSKLILTRFGPRTQASAYKKYREACGRDRRVKELWGPAAPFAK